MITLQEAKSHLRIEPEFVEEDALIESLISAAILSLEHQTGRAFRDREETLILDRWEQPVRLPWWPVQAINEITYFDADGVQQTLPGYSLDLRTIPATLTPYPNETWPEAKQRPQAITIKVQVGMQELPEDLKRAALLLIGNLYENREAVVVGTIVATLPMAVDFLIQPYRILRIA
ncbi:head-tail connector protein [Marinobacter subterrani]|uniref:Phagel protein phiE125 n=1 Tax=Marinobacter subterrani TaxID=1658765 RepID=A0A0J7JA20_9GAMM|nr:head-tail connector protein [Marinobacter subterrani]KMQ75298.1 phagel protein phiE125 [Marinobacter subterrani]